MDYNIKKIELLPTFSRISIGVLATLGTYIPTCPNRGQHVLCMSKVSSFFHFNQLSMVDAN